MHGLRTLNGILKRVDIILIFSIHAKFCIMIRSTQSHLFEKKKKTNAPNIIIHLSLKMNIKVLENVKGKKKFKILVVTWMCALK